MFDGDIIWRCYSFLQHQWWACAVSVSNRARDLVQRSTWRGQALPARNLINGCGFICFASGAFDNYIQEPLEKGLARAPWFALIAAVVFSTVQTQDMYDQDADRIRIRQTMPLVIGDQLARKATALLVTFWSVVVPCSWSLSFLLSVPFASLGAIIAVRTLVYRTVVSDERTFWIWNAWMVVFYFTPLFCKMSQNL